MVPDQKYMKQAISLARLGAGWVSPNPMVGAVLVCNDRVIGSGYHEFFGGPHAEVNAISSVAEADRHLISKSTLYVNLEPCVHFGKTPPCADLIIENRIPRVVTGMADPNTLVGGGGIEKLRSHGIEVTTDCEAARSRLLNEVFIKYITLHKPFVVLKSAMTLDGKIATVTNASRWITGVASRKLVHELRQRLSAVMVGVDTVLYDDPLLNIRLDKSFRKSPKGSSLIEPTCRNPVKIIADTRGRIPLEARVLTNDPQLTIVAATELAPASKLKEIGRMGAQVMICPVKHNQVDLQFVISALGEMEIDSVMIEGGSTLAFSAIREGIVDKVISFIAPKILGGAQAPTPVGGQGIETMDQAVELVNISSRKVGADIMIEGYLKHNTNIN